MSMIIIGAALAIIVVVALCVTRRMRQHRDIVDAVRSQTLSLCQGLAADLGIAAPIGDAVDAALWSETVLSCGPWLRAPLPVWAEILVEREFLQGLANRLPLETKGEADASPLGLTHPFAKRLEPYVCAQPREEGISQWAWLRPACWHLRELRAAFPQLDPRVILTILHQILRGQERGLRRAGLTIVQACRALEAYELQTGRLDPEVRIVRPRVP